MHIILRYFNSYNNIVNQQIETNVWVKAASCTNLVDAQAQLQRFIDSGIPADHLQLTFEE